MIYEKIRCLCIEKKMSIRSVERKAGLGNGTIRNWKKCAPTVDNIKKVADILDCTLDDLMGEHQEEKEVV